MDFKDTIKELFTSGHYTLISYMKGGTQEWNVARDYNADDKSWSAGNYCYSLESALAVFLERTNSNLIKSDYQIEVEKNYPDLSYARMVELSTQFKDGLFMDDEESAKEYFEDTCEMSEGEKMFFGLQEVEEIPEEDMLEEDVEKPVIAPRL